MADDATQTADADAELQADDGVDAGVAVDAADADTDADEDFDDDDDEFDDATCAERVLESCLRAIVDRPEEIDIGVDEHDRRLTLHVRVATEDMGKIIGKRGRVANALRTLIKAAGTREGYSATVEIDD
ncbi:MAG: KH domain-containing protein [Acidimicrobiia bacterium]|nr:KH domain-containing protein [Acidimicrobiia bacterium]